MYITAPFNKTLIIILELTHRHKISHEWERNAHSQRDGVSVPNDAADSSDVLHYSVSQPMRKLIVNKQRHFVSLLAYA